jgi:hypothetical protein
MSYMHLDTGLLGPSEHLDQLANNCTFSCLHKSLRKLTLKFTTKEVFSSRSSFTTSFVENAMVVIL